MARYIFNSSKQTSQRKHNMLRKLIAMVSPVPDLTEEEYQDALARLAAIDKRIESFRAGVTDYEARAASVHRRLDHGRRVL
jgi:chromosome segregation ATPase